MDNKFIEGFLMGVVALGLGFGSLFLGNVISLSASNTLPPHSHTTDLSVVSTTQSTTVDTQAKALFESTLVLDDPNTAPTLTMTVFRDAQAGFNIQIETTNFTFAPENAGGEHVAGEGHAQLYVDGALQGRIYSEWTYLDDLTVGFHDIAVYLVGNDSSVFIVDNVEIMDTAIIEVQ